jgi:hypothetical protein
MWSCGIVDCTHQRKRNANVQGYVQVSHALLTHILIFSKNTETEIALKLTMPRLAPEIRWSCSRT